MKYSQPDRQQDSVGKQNLLISTGGFLGVWYGSSLLGLDLTLYKCTHGGLTWREREGTVYPRPTAGRGPLTKGK